jgi:hypothetical protein
MTEEKFTPEYFEIHYHMKDNTVYRNEDSSGECQGAKEKCLRACFTHFLKEDLTGTKSIGKHFKTDGKIRRDVLTRCCCSQFEENGIMHAIVTHKSTNISFIVGSVCFKKLFWDAEDVDTFFKEECKYCGRIVAKRAYDRPNLCNQECAKNYEEQESRKKIVYVPPPPPPKKVWPKKVYDKCEECEKPKYTENHRKYPLCYNCDQEKKLDKMLRSPDGEIHGHAD